MEYQMKFLIYLPLAFGIASLISIFTFDSFLFGVILGLLGIVSMFFAHDKYPDEENTIFSGGVLSYTGITTVACIMIEKYFG